MKNLLRRTFLAGALALPAAVLSPLSAYAEAKLTFATAYAGGDGQIGQTMQKLKDLAAEKSGGSVNIELFFDSSLGTERELLEALVTGAGDMSMAGISDVVYWMPEYFLSVPYLFESVAHVRAVYDGPIGKEIDQLMLEKKGLRTLAIMNRGARHVSSNKKIEKPADMNGLRLRLPENPLWIAIWKQLGVNATTISYNELYTALQTGVVEAQENPLESIVNSKFYEVQKYVVLTGHVRDVYKIQISEKSWAKLTPEEQTALQAAATEAALFGDGLLASSEEKSLQVLKESGTEVIEVDTKAFSDAMADSKNIADQFLKPGLYQKVKEAAPKS